MTNRSDAELNLWIAENLEPIRNWTIYSGAISPEGAWRVDDCLNPYNAWQPRNMVNDPAMTVMLMEKLIQQPHEFSAETVFELVLDRIDRRDWNLIEGERAQRDEQARLFKRAVAEAWAISQGWNNGKS